MRKAILSLVILFFSVFAFSQDYIYLKDNSIIEAVVKEVNVNMIKYTKHTDPEGEVFAIAPEAVVKIVFSNGYVREFSEGASPKKVSSSERDNYFALAAGYGRSYGGMGIRVQGRFGKKQGFGVHAGVGYNPSNTGGGCFGVGVKFFYYRWLYINAQVGNVTHDYGYDTYWGYDYEWTESVFGVSILTGGDFIFGNHADLNVAIGPTITNRGIKLGFDLGFVFKF